mgnify:FL=1
MRGDSQLALLANLHSQQTFIPALDHLASTNREVERSTTVIAGVELSAISECALVVDIDVVP